MEYINREMPKYKSHKEIHALKIKEIRESEEQGGVAQLVFEDTRFAPREVDHWWVDKHNPKAGGYFVVYADGYQSWSPAEAFEEGYTLVE